MYSISGVVDLYSMGACLVQESQDSHSCLSVLENE